VGALVVVVVGLPGAGAFVDVVVGALVEVVLGLPGTVGAAELVVVAVVGAVDEATGALPPKVTTI